MASSAESRYKSIQKTWQTDCRKILWVSRNKETELSFSRTDRLWVKQRVTAKFEVFDFLAMIPNKSESGNNFPRFLARSHKVNVSRNVETQNRRLKDSASWKLANYFATYGIVKFKIFAGGSGLWLSLKLYYTVSFLLSRLFSFFYLW